MVGSKYSIRSAKELRRIKQTYDARVFYACESCSRAWGFASHDRDHDGGEPACWNAR